MDAPHEQRLTSLPSSLHNHTEAPAASANTSEDPLQRRVMN